MECSIKYIQIWGFYGIFLSIPFDSRKQPKTWFAQGIEEFLQSWFFGNIPPFGFHGFKTDCAVITNQQGLLVPLKR